MSWRPISTYEHDGTMVLLLVTGGECPTEDVGEGEHWQTIGFNDEDLTGHDTWHLAGWTWEHDEFTAATGVPAYWQPMPGSEVSNQPE